MPAEPPVSDAPPRVTERYYEFDDVPGVHRLRVHRSSYVTDVLMMSPQVQPGRALATFQVRPVDATNVRSFIAYLWTQHEDTLEGQKVLSSFATDAPTEVVHSMYVLRLVTGPQMRDRIELKLLQYHVSKTTGVVTASISSIRDIRVGLF